EILTMLHQLFTSAAVGVWVKLGLLKYEYITSDTPVKFEEQFLDDIKAWITRSEDDIIRMENLKTNGDSTQVGTLREWRKAVVREEQLLGMYVGKAAVNVWLDYDNNNFDETKTAFLLGLKYYRILCNQSAGRSTYTGML